MIQNVSSWWNDLQACFASFKSRLNTAPVGIGAAGLRGVEAEGWTGLFKITVAEAVVVITVAEERVVDVVICTVGGLRSWRK